MQHSIRMLCIVVLDKWCQLLVHAVMDVCLLLNQCFSNLIISLKSWLLMVAWVVSIRLWLNVAVKLFLRSLVKVNHYQMFVVIYLLVNRLVLILIFVLLLLVKLSHSASSLTMPSFLAILWSLVRKQTLLCWPLVRERVAWKKACHLSAIMKIGCDLIC